MDTVSVAIAGVSPGWEAGFGLGLMLLGLALLAAFVVVAIRLRTWRGISGIENLVGAQGTVKAKTKDGVIIHALSDDWWLAEIPDHLQVGQKVEVVAVEGLRVKVRPLEPGAEAVQKKRGGKS